MEAPPYFSKPVQSSTATISAVALHYSLEEYELIPFRIICTDEKKYLDDVEDYKKQISYIVYSPILGSLYSFYGSTTRTISLKKNRKNVKLIQNEIGKILSQGDDEVEIFQDARIEQQVNTFIDLICQAYSSKGLHSTVETPVKIATIQISSCVDENSLLPSVYALYHCLKSKSWRPFVFPMVFKLFPLHWLI